jgi:5-methylthioribose kinase
MGFEIGDVIANLLLNYAGQTHWSKDEASRKVRRAYLLDTAQDVWTQFEAIAALHSLANWPKWSNRQSNPSVRNSCTKEQPAMNKQHD